METSRTDLILIERYLDKHLDSEEEYYVQARMKSDANFRLDVAAQTEVRSMVQRYHYARLKRHIQVLHAGLIHAPSRRSLRLVIEALFKF